MNNNMTRVTLVTTGAVLFNLIFWHEKLGLNTALFDVFLLIALFSLYPQARQHTTVRWLLLGHLTCLAMVLLHNTMLSKMAFVITLLLTTAFAEYVHRSVWFAGGSVLLNLAMVAASFVEPIQFKRSPKRRRITRVIRFAIVPVVLVLLFLVLYRSGNSVFSKLVLQIGVQMDFFLGNLSNFFLWQRVLFLLLGLLITGMILLKSNVNYFSEAEAGMKDDLIRARAVRRNAVLYWFIKSFMGRMANGMIALKNENTVGIISLALLNGLLLLVNVIDINYLWFGFHYEGPAYRMVHEGTGTLILSIVVAMAILLFFFKGNLNFYKKNKWLKCGAYAWIIQNVVLVSSVMLRDYYYILKHGLAYKRIGVLFFLLMVIIGLATVFVKIWGRKTSYFLFRVNAWAGVVVLVLATTIHWDEFIARYNLQRKNEVELDVPFLLSLGDKTLPLLHRNSASLTAAHVLELKEREEQFLQHQQSYTWLSWNYADAVSKQYFQKH
jgi:hypothetical protein